MIETTVRCDNKSCKEHAPVGGPGQLPKAWIVLRFLRMKLMNDGQTSEEEAMLTFCGWKCVLAFVKGMAREQPPQKRQKTPTIEVARA